MRRSTILTVVISIAAASMISASAAMSFDRDSVFRAKADSPAVTSVQSTTSTTTTTVPPDDGDVVEFTGLEIKASDTTKVREQLENSDLQIEADVPTENHIKDNKIDPNRAAGSGVAAVTTSTKEGDDLKAGKVDISISDVVGNIGDISLGDKTGHRIMAGTITADEQGGTLSPSVLVQVIQNNLGGVRGCYEKILKYNNNISGRFYVEVTVAVDGSVGNVVVLEDTVRDGDLTSCITSKIYRWRFPPPSGGEFKFSYPFNFVQTF